MVLQLNLTKFLMPKSNPCAPLSKPPSPIQYVQVFDITISEINHLLKLHRTK